MEEVKVSGRFAPGCEPRYGSHHAAGADLYANLDKELLLPPGGRLLIPTGVYLQIPPGYEGQVRPRSGLAARHGVTILNSPGTIDSDYRGEVQVIIYNSSSEPYLIAPGSRIAQLIIAPVSRVQFVAVDTLEESRRGTGGFGSTGI